MGNPGDVQAIHAESVQGVADRCGQVGDRRRYRGGSDFLSPGEVDFGNYQVRAS
jgi:hypothetical protein